MKAHKSWFQQTRDWLQDNGWAVFAYLAGMATTLVIMADSVGDRSFTVAVATAIGTVGAAVAALWNTLLSRKSLDRQINYEQELKQPNLKLSSVGIEEFKGYYRLLTELTNLGQFPIYVEEAVTSTPGTDFYTPRIDFTLIKEGTIEEHDERGFLIPPNVSVKRVLKFYSLDPGEDSHGTLAFVFQYSPTVKKLHYLEVEVDISPDIDAVNVFVHHEGRLYMESFFYEDPVDESD